MNTVSFEAKKAEAAKLILLENNEAVVDKVIACLKDNKKEETAPCLFTADELKAEVEQSVWQHKNGQIKTQEELFSKIEKLLAE
ncbi:hypothetical protein LJC44_04700 [Parabacteroides sp. OttesenSCG-928-G06]|nr:hypothetical protein [Parabacteroides sp. OttesenSCG-928-K15]MDL2282388.1 hypothetical protein [Parabacteroides sp. OttesenSCG-928-G06]